MPIIINYNICDNSPECSGMSVCPTNAIKWDDNLINLLGTKGTLNVDNANCISCGKCVSEDGCPVGAIIFAKSEEELSEFSKDFEIDTTKVESLFVDRYGAEPIDDNICISFENVLLKSNEITIIEELSEDSIQCLITSIPIESIIKHVENYTNKKVKYYKCLSSDKNKTEHPILYLYYDKNLIGSINGYYDNSKTDEFFDKINEIIVN